MQSWSAELIAAFQRIALDIPISWNSSKSGIRAPVSRSTPPSTLEIWNHCSPCSPPCVADSTAEEVSQIRRPTLSIVKMMCCPKALLTTPDMRWGTQHEEATMMCLPGSQHFDHKVEQCKFVIRCRFTQAVASPDGFL